ncbi:VanZ like family protein [Syntrophus gentianae]|uniref:VanZ like family protein n=1 Tax=Syntrophus gentianae TaxID=43775 RepID=A0A1H7XZX7_9BACT|nr:VanZ family protein [Syntrophus gentianae]SEM39273.1 VanZ like family protein [Syntrophus gentianae]
MKGFSLKYWLPVLLWMGVIFGMSTGTFSADHTSRFIGPLLHFLFPGLPEQDIELFHGMIRKAGHVSEYFILGLLFFHGVRGNSSQRWRLRWALTAILAVVLFALSDEYHQSWVASRTASLVDVSIDSVGGVLSQIAILLKDKMLGHSTSRPA